jgi:hypothetical protein
VIVKLSFIDILLMRDILEQIFKEREYIGKLVALT